MSTPKSNFMKKYIPVECDKCRLDIGRAVVTKYFFFCPEK